MRVVVSLVLVAFLPGVAVACWRLCVALAHDMSLLLPLALGAVAGVALDQVLLRRLPGFETFEHELTHAIAALCCLRSVTGFRVTRRQGGWVQHTGGFGGQLADDVIGFAPYVLPTFTVASVLLRPLLPAGCFPWYDVWLGGTLGFHAWSTARETAESWSHRRFQSAGSGEWVESDTARRGLAYSAVYITTVTLALHGLVLAVVLHGYRGFAAWGRLVWPATVAAGRLVASWLGSLGG